MRRVGRNIHPDLLTAEATTIRLLLVGYSKNNFRTVYELRRATDLPVAVALSSAASLSTIHGRRYWAVYAFANLRYILQQCTNVYILSC
jgi:hypothetical protein